MENSDEMSPSIPDWSLDRNSRIDPFRRMWKKIFLISCVFAILMDPLFFYIPILKEDIKCFDLDKKLKTTVIVSRSITDISFVLDIIFQVYTTVQAKRSMAKKTYKRSRASKSSAIVRIKRSLRLYIVLIDILAILPFPQVVIFLFYSKVVRGSRCLNVLVLMQYSLRVLRIILSWEELSLKIQLWVKAAFSFLPFILVSHVLGAFWYFLSIQREIDCWQYACWSESGCESSTFDCDEYMLKNITVVNDLCSKNPQNEWLFDFGIYLDALKSGMLGSTDVPRKLLHCLWWGLRHMSSLGQNLQTSSNAGENIFALTIFVFGMLLFVVYVNDILEIRQQWQNNKAEKLEKKKKRNRDIQSWLITNGIPKNMHNQIMEAVDREIGNKEDFDVENIPFILPLTERRLVRHYMRIAMLQKVPMFQTMFQTMDKRILKELCEHLKRMNYNDDDQIIEEGEPLDRMLFITQGIAITYELTDGKNMSREFLRKGDFFGEVVVNWASEFTSDDVPISTRTVKSVYKVEALELMANDIKSVVRKYWWHLIKEKLLIYKDNPQLKELAASSLTALFRRRRQAKKRRRHDPLRVTW